MTRMLANSLRRYQNSTSGNFPSNALAQGSRFSPCREVMSRSCGDSSERPGFQMAGGVLLAAPFCIAILQGAWNKTNSYFGANQQLLWRKPTVPFAQTNSSFRVNQQFFLSKPTVLFEQTNSSFSSIQRGDGLTASWLSLQRVSAHVSCDVSPSSVTPSRASLYIEAIAKVLQLPRHSEG